MLTMVDSSKFLFFHSEKRKKLSRIKSRSGESHSLRTSSSSRHPSSNNRLSSKTRPTTKHKESNDVNSSRSHQIKYKSSKNSTQSGNDNLDPLTRAVEENLRHSKQREKPDETMPKRVDNVISRLDESSLKEKALQLSPEMTISSIVRELVFHEKVRRVCVREREKKEGCKCQRSDRYIAMKITRIIISQRCPCPSAKLLLLFFLLHQINI